MKHAGCRRGAAAVALTAWLSPLLGCGDHESVADKSAKAFREAQRRGESFAGEGHAHGHGPMEVGAAPSAAATAVAPRMEGHDMSGMQGHGMAGGEHAAMGRTAHDMPGSSGPSTSGHDMSGVQGHPMGSMPGHDKASMPGHDMGSMPHGGSGIHPAHPADPAAHDMTSMGHSATVHPPVQEAVSAPPGAPAAALEPDPVDAPAATSVAEAHRSSEVGSAMGGMAGMHGGGSYRQRDVGREPTPAGQQPPPAPEPPHHAPTPPPGHERDRK
jgi:hypothetical protein